MRRQPRRPAFVWLVLLLCGVYAGFFVFTACLSARSYGRFKNPRWIARPDDTGWVVANVDDAGAAAGRLERGDRLLAINGDAPPSWASPRLSTCAATRCIGSKLDVGTRPSIGQTPQEILMALVQSDYQLPGDSAEIRALDAVVQRCLAKDPRDRYGSAAELANDLVPALARRGVSEAQPHSLKNVRVANTGRMEHAISARAN